jgi:hypothetical protein
MSRKEYIFSMILATYAVISSLGAAIYGLIVPNTTTPWFWFTATGVFIIAGILEHLRYIRTIKLIERSKP